MGMTTDQATALTFTTLVMAVVALIVVDWAA